MSKRPAKSKKRRLCYDCGTAGTEEDIERFKRSLDYGSHDACDKCGAVGFTVKFKPYILANPNP